MELKPKTEGPHRKAGIFPAAAACVSSSVWWLVIPLLVLTALAAQAQSGSVSGIVVNSWDGTPLGGVVVTVHGTTLAAQTDASGHFELNNLPPGDQVLRFSKPSYASTVVSDVRVLAGQTTTVNGNLRPEFYEMEEYEVTAEVLGEQTERILLERQSATSMTHSMGSEMLSRLGTSDAADAVTKVSGSTIVDGKYAVVRGLNDRYVPTLLNGAVVPSSDPYRRSASLDQFPTAVVEEVAISKTFTPDLPGDFTGGGVNVVTKRFPEKAFLNAKVGAAYNSQATFNDKFLTYDGGNTDWLGMDDGSRELPSSVSYGVDVPPATTLTPPPSSPAYEENVANAKTLNAQVHDLGTTEFAPHTSAPPPDQKLGLSLGKTFDVYGQPVGLLAAIDYKHEYRFDDDGTQRRYQGTDILRSEYGDARSLTTVAWAAMGSIATRLWEHHEVGFDFLYSQTSQDTARIQTGTNYIGSPDLTTIQNKLQYIENNLSTYQVRGHSDFPEIGNLELDYTVASTCTSQDEPNTRFFNYTLQGTNGFTGGNFLPNPSFPTRYYSSLDEHSLQWKVDLTLPFEQWSGLEAKIKGGINQFNSDRNFNERTFSYRGAAPWVGSDPNTYLTEDNLGYDPTEISGGRTRWNWQRYFIAYTSEYSGSRSVNAGYWMLDIPLVESLRMVGGARAEKTDIEINSFSYLPSSITGERANSSKLDQSDLLPSVGLIWSLRKDMNIRASYSQTVARPSFRELAAYRSYDPNLDTELEGNPNLQMSSIDNYDLSWDWFPRPSSVVGISLFYKSLTLPIEQAFVSLDGSIMSWRNVDSADVMGVEFEVRQRLDVIDDSMADFSLGGNFALIHSSTDLTKDELLIKEQYVPGTDDTRPLSEQSPYILNLDATYDNQQSGTTVTLVFNMTGPRMVVASLTTDDIYEQPAPQLDLIASQRIFKNAYLRFNIKNLLNPKKELTYGEDGDLTFSSYKSGITYQLGLDFKF